MSYETILQPYPPIFGDSELERWCFVLYFQKRNFEFYATKRSPN